MNIYEIINKKVIPTKVEVKNVIDNIINDLKKLYGVNVDVYLLDKDDSINRGITFLDRLYNNYEFFISDGAYYEKEYINNNIRSDYIEIYYKSNNNNFWYSLLSCLFHEYYHAIAYNKDRNGIINSENFIYFIEKLLLENFNIFNKVNYNSLFSELQADYFSSNMLYKFILNNDIDIDKNYVLFVKEMSKKNLFNFNIDSYLDYFTKKYISKIDLYDVNNGWLFNFLNDDGSFRNITQIFNNVKLSNDTKNMFLSSNSYIRYLLKNKVILSKGEFEILDNVLNNKVNKFDNYEKYSWIYNLELDDYYSYLCSIDNKIFTNNRKNKKEALKLQKKLYRNLK